MSEACPELSPEGWEPQLEEDLRHLNGRELNDQLSRRCLQRLSEAWGDLNYRYLRSRLKPPQIKLHRGERRWGSWDAGRRLLTISDRQVLCYTWDSAVETLKHEMAHQYVSEIMFRDQEVAHGPAFRQACKLLSVDPAALGDGGVSLFRPGGLGIADPDDARLLRVQKLLALADNNPDEHEARAAFARASELMLKYNLDSSDLRRQDYVYRHLGKSSGRIPSHRYAIAGILQEFFFVECIWIDSYVVETGVSGHRLEIMGKRANVDMAEYVYECLIRQSESLWKNYKQERKLKGRAAKREYLDGLLSGFGQQLRSKSAQSQERGLVWVGDPALKGYLRQRHPRTMRSRLAAVNCSEARAHGLQAGEKLRLHRPISPTPSSPQRGYLPGPS